MHVCGSSQRSCAHYLRTDSRALTSLSTLLPHCMLQDAITFRLGRQLDVMVEKRMHQQQPAGAAVKKHT